MVQLKEVETNSDLKKFVKFPLKMYKNNPYYIPSLISGEINTLRKDKNAAFEYCEAKYWLAYKDGKIAGRIAGIINHEYIKKWKNKFARFGWIDFIDDPEVSAALLGAVEEWAKENGMEGILGPLGFTDFDEEGMLIEGFEELGTLALIYNFPYYPKHLETLGYEKDADWLEFEIQQPEEIHEKILRLNEIVLKRNKLHLVPAKKAKDLRPYARGVFELINDTYADLYGFVELNDKQIDGYIEEYFPFIDPQYTKIIIDENDKVAAFGITMPSLSRALQKAKGRLFPFGWIHMLYALKNPKSLDMYLVGVRKEFQNKGIPAVLLAEVTQACIRNDIKTAETAAELEENLEVQSMWKHFPKRQHKRRRCYIKKLS